MGLFGKKKEEKKGELPNLPELLKLPELPEFGNVPDDDKKIPQLPIFPSNSLGEKFSQDTIKEAVTGKKEVNYGSEADEFESTKDEMRMMPEPLETHNITTKITRKELDDDEPEFPMMSKTRAPKEFGRATRKVKGMEPVFIRLDKFEEGLKLFEKTREKIMQIEEDLREIKNLKIEEEKELEIWESELRKIKDQIEKVDQDIFSKIN